MHTGYYLAASTLTESLTVSTGYGLLQQSPITCCTVQELAVKDMITRQNDILKERNLYMVDYKFCSKALAQTEKVEGIRKAHLSLCQ
jgi:hypothetical protein